MQRTVYTELAYWRKRAISNGSQAKVVSRRDFPRWYEWHVVAVAFNPKTGKDHYLVVKH